MPLENHPHNTLDSDGPRLSKPTFPEFRVGPAHTFIASDLHITNINRGRRRSLRRPSSMYHSVAGLSGSRRDLELAGREA